MAENASELTDSEELHPFRLIPGGVTPAGPVELTAGLVIVGSIAFIWLMGRAFKGARGEHVHLGLVAGGIAFAEWLVAKAFWNVARDKLADAEHPVGEAMAWWG